MTKSQEDNFYSEMDKKSTRRSCCTCQTMLLMFGILLAILIIGIYFLVHQIKQTNIRPSAISINVARVKKDFSSKINQSLANKENPNLVVTSDDLTALASEGISVQDLILKNVQFVINPETIKVYGKLLKPLQSDVEIDAIAQVESGKLKIKIQKISAGKLSLPKIFYSTIQNSFNNILDQNLKSYYEKCEVSKIELQTDQMVIYGKLK